MRINGRERNMRGLVVIKRIPHQQSGSLVKVHSRVCFISYICIMIIIYVMYNKRILILLVQLITKNRKLCYWEF